MKWTCKPEERYPSLGDTRTVTRFLWFPKRIDDEKRWLCKASWREELIYTGAGGGSSRWVDTGGWIDEVGTI